MTIPKPVTTLSFMLAFLVLPTTYSQGNCPSFLNTTLDIAGYARCQSSYLLFFFSPSIQTSNTQEDCLNAAGGLLYATENYTSGLQIEVYNISENCPYYCMFGINENIENELNTTGTTFVEEDCDDASKASSGETLIVLQGENSNSGIERIAGGNGAAVNIVVNSAIQASFVGVKAGVAYIFISCFAIEYNLINPKYLYCPLKSDTLPPPMFNNILLPPPVHAVAPSSIKPTPTPTPTMTSTPTPTPTLAPSNNSNKKNEFNYYAISLCIILLLHYIN